MKATDCLVLILSSLDTVLARPSASTPNLEPRSDVSSSSPADLGDYIVSALGYGPSEAEATSNVVANTTVIPISSALPYSSQRHWNSSSIAQSSSSVPASSEHNASMTVTAVYSRTRVSIVGTSDSPSSVATIPTSESLFSSQANASLYSSDLLSSHSPYPIGGGDGLNSTRAYLSTGSSALSHSTVQYNQTKASGQPLGTGSYGANATTLLGSESPAAHVSGHVSSSRAEIGLYGTNSTALPGSASFTSFNGGNLTSSLVGTGHGHEQINTSLPRTGHGYSYAQACNKASVDWTLSWMSEPTSQGSVETPVAGPTLGPDDLYTLCDGIPRLKANRTTSLSTHRTFWEIGPAVTLPGAPAQPNCTILPTDCASLQSSYSIAHDVPAHVAIQRTHDWMTYMSDDWPRCNVNTIPASQPGADCAIRGYGIELLYWPQVWAEGEDSQNKYCNALGGYSESITMGPTIAGQPNTMVSGSHTFVSPTVYIKYSDLFAVDYGGAPVGPTLHDGIVGVDSTLISTKLPWFWTNIPWTGPGGLLEIALSTGIMDAKVKHGYQGINGNFGDEHVPLRYPDLERPLPALPYFQNRVKLAYYDHACWFGGCPTMIPGDVGPGWGPVLAIPDTMRFLAPEWNSCTMAWGGMDDPPHALVQAPAATPTAPSAYAPTTAAEPLPTNALPAQRTRATLATPAGYGGDDVVSTGNIPRPTSDPRGKANLSQGQNQAKLDQSADDDAASPRTAVNNQPDRTSTTNDVAGLIASLLHGAGNSTSLSATTQTHGASSGADGGADPGSEDAGKPANAGGSSDATASTVDETSNPAGSDSTVDAVDPPQQPQNAGNPSPNSITPTQGSVVGSDNGSETLPEADNNRGGAASQGSGESPGGNSLPQPEAGSNAPDAIESGIASITLGSNTIAIQPASADSANIVVGSQTLTAGGSVVVIDGHTASAAPDGQLIVDGESQGAPAAQPGQDAHSSAHQPAPVTLGTRIFPVQSAAGSDGAVVINGNTLVRGDAPVTVDGRAVSLDIQGKVHVDGSVVGPADSAAQGMTLPLAGMTEMIASLTLDGETALASFTALPEGIVAAVIDGTTVISGGQPVVIDDMLVSLGADGVALQAVESTITFSDSLATIIAGPSILTASKTVLPGGQTAAIIGSQTLRIGGPAQTIEGDVFSFGPNGLVELGEATAAQFVSSASLLTIQSQTMLARYTILPNGKSQAIVGTRTIDFQGGAVTINGAIVSFGADGLVLERTAQTTSSLAAESVATPPPVTAPIKAQATATETVAPSNGATSSSGFTPMFWLMLTSLALLGIYR